MIRTIFMGTPDIADVILKSLIDSDQLEIIAVVTQPDKPKGRGKEVACPVVKVTAMEHNIPVYQPVKAREESFINQMRALSPDLMIVVAFGQILTQELLDVPRLGCINVHASLLPKYRGAAPIQQVIIEGEETTGVTIMKMDAGIDTGDMIYQEVIKIDPKETGGTLHDRLAVVGSHALLTALPSIIDGSCTLTKQDNTQATYVRQYKKEAGSIDFNQSAVTIERLVRGLNPWPSAYTKLHGKTLKIWDADVIDCLLNESDQSFENGTIVQIEKDGFFVKTKEGYLKVKELQLEGKKRMQCGDFLRGYPLEIGTTLGV